MARLLASFLLVSGISHVVNSSETSGPGLDLTACHSLMFVSDVQDEHCAMDHVPVSLAVSGLRESLEYHVEISIGKEGAMSSSTVPVAPSTGLPATQVSLQLPGLPSGLWKLSIEVKCAKTGTCEHGSTPTGTLVGMECLNSTNSISHSSSMILSMVECSSASLSQEAVQREWETDPDRWMKWWPSAYREIGRNLLVLNRPENVGKSGSADSVFGGTPALGTEQATLRPFDFPAYVINLPHRPERKEHSAQLLANLGFENVKFPPATLKGDLDLDDRMFNDSRPAAERLGVQVKNEFESYGVSESTGRAYMARALDQHACMEEALRQGWSHFAIFEDDLLPVASFAETNRRIHAAVAALPPWADFLLLEMCFEECEELRYHPRNPHMFWSARPQCSGGMLFTAAGARRALQLTSPVWSSLDTMIVSLVMRGQLVSMTMMPPALYQDNFWGSDAGREAAREDPNIYAGVQFINIPILYNTTLLSYDTLAKMMARSPSPFSGPELAALERSEWWQEVSSTRYLLLPVAPILDWAPPGKRPISMLVDTHRNYMEAAAVEADWEFAVLAIPSDTVNCPHNGSCQLLVVRDVGDGEDADPDSPEGDESWHLIQNYKLVLIVIEGEM